MNIQIPKLNDPTVQPLKQSNIRGYEAWRKSELIAVPIQELHGFGFSGDVYTGDDMFPPVILKNHCKLQYLTIKFTTPPSGADFQMNIFKQDTGASILKDSILIYPADFTEVIVRSEFAISEFSRDNKIDTLGASVIQVGSTTAGSLLTVMLVFAVLGKLG